MHDTSINKIKEFEQIGGDLSCINTLVNGREDPHKLLEKLLCDTNTCNDIFRYSGTEITFENARLL